MTTELQQQFVKFGTTVFQGQRIHIPEYDQTLQRIGVGGELERLTQQGRQTGYISDFSGGLVSASGIVDWRQGLNVVWRNQGLQTRAGMPVLPYKITNQDGVTSDESLSSKVASNWRRHEVRTSLGTTEERIYIAVGHKLYRNKGSGDSELELADTFTDIVTGMCLYNVNGSEVLTVFTNGTTDDIKYTADPTAGTISWTTLVALSSGDYVIPLGKGYFPSLGTGVNAMQGTIGGTSGIWWMDTATAATWTMEPLVLGDGKDLPGNATAVTLTAINPAFVASQGVGTQENADATSQQSGAWSNTANAIGSDDSYTTETIPQIDATGATRFSFKTADLVASGFDISSMPRGSFLVGAEFTVEHSVSTASRHSGVSCHAQLILDGSAVGLERTITFSEATSDATLTFGSTSDTWGLGDTSGFTSVGVRVWFTGDVTSSAGTVDMKVDAIKLSNFKYKPGGTMISLTDGGYPVAHNGVFPHRATLVAPVSTDKTAITKPREMWFVDLEWDTNTERPVMSLSQPNEGMEYVYGCTSFQGGYLIWGGNDSGDRGLKLKHLDSSNNLRDFAFPAVHGSTAVRIEMAYAVGNWALLGVVNADYSDFQWWWWNNGKYYPDFLLQSLSDKAIAHEPIPVATGALNTQDSRVYLIYDNGSSHTAVSRNFFPPDPSQDPRVTNTSEVRSEAFSSGTEQNPVYLISNELNFGPEEASKTLLNLRYLGRHISTATGGSYGSVTIDFVTDNDTTFASPEVTKEFTSALSSYDVPSSGVVYETLRFRIGLKHDLASVESPDAGPILITTKQQWPHQRSFYFVCYYFDPDYFTVIDSLYAYAAAGTKNVQALSFGDQSVPAVFYGVQQAPQNMWAYLAEYGSQFKSEQWIGDDRSKQRGTAFFSLLRFDEVPGTV